MWTKLTPESCPEAMRPVLLRLPAGTVKQIESAADIRVAIVEMIYERDGFGTRRPKHWQQYRLGHEAHGGYHVTSHHTITLNVKQEWMYLDLPPFVKDVSPFVKDVPEF